MSAVASSVSAFVDELDAAYEELHTKKEDAFWAAYMGLSDDADAARKELDRAEIALKQWLQDPERQSAVREQLAAAEAASADEAPDASVLVALRGWLHTLRANGIESAEARALAAEIVADEGALARARGTMQLGYEHPEEGFVEASSVKLGLMVANEKEEPLRKAAWEGLRRIEDHVLANGFLDIVRKRNRLGRMLGGEDYYDATVKRVEGMSKADVFALLDELEERTRDTARHAIEQLRAERGDAAATAWNVKFLTAGDVTAEQEPYFPFSRALERWMRSFSAMNVRYRDAELVLDLVDRKGKYENGFMHGPVPAWTRHGSWRPARIQFTANAIPGMTGAGRRAADTLFHEGGHAAHFANIDMPSPCFAQEFAPTSVAFCETQSMFFDSLLGDADWQARYARTESGEPMPFALVEKSIRAGQPFAAWNVRAWLCVCYGEKAIYEIPDDELTAERVLDELRAVERRLLFLDTGSTRPVLSVPHLLAGESSAYYHGYVLAEMAVEQTRRHFLARDGFLVDNPRIGPELAEAYWQPGNSVRFDTYLERLTGTPLGAVALAERLNRSVDECIERARKAYEAEPGLPRAEGAIALDARVRVMHGNETVASTEEGGFDGCAARFSSWIDSLASSAAAG